MFDRTAFDQFVDGLSLNHFSSSELLTKTTNHHNHPPEAAIWDNIAPTILVLDQLRAHFNVSISLNSVYRAYEYNRRLSGSAKYSQHIAFTAIDFRTNNRSLLDDFFRTLASWRGNWFSAPREFNQTIVNVDGKPIPSKPLNWRDGASGKEFQFRGGVSLYSSFVHIDTRGFDVGW